MGFLCLEGRQKEPAEIPDSKLQTLNPKTSNTMSAGTDCTQTIIDFAPTYPSLSNTSHSLICAEVWIVSFSCSCGYIAKIFK